MATIGDWISEELRTPLVAYYRDLLIAHADDLVTQVCAICQMQQCPDWRTAHEWLSAAGELTEREPHYPAVADLDRKPRP